MATLSASATQKLQAIIDNAVKNPQDIPGTAVAIANKNGEVLFSYAAGQIGSETPNEPITTDSIFWIASCTKITGTIVALQAVDKGLLSLDSPDDVDKYCPELANIPILQSVSETEGVKLVPKTKRITLRMLLAHTAGFGYSFFNHNLKAYTKLFGIDDLSGNANSVSTPLSFEPGTSWEYGVGIDWACILVSRAEGVSLNNLITQNILKPAGITDTSMRPTEDMKSRLVHMNYRDPSGKLVEQNHLMTATLSNDPVVAAQSIESAGAGIFSKPTEYIKLLAILLNKGVAGQTGARILSEASVQEMFTNQLPDWPDFARAGIPAAEPTLTNPLPELFPQPGNPPQGWGLSWFLNIHEAEATGRSAGSGFWCGLANLFYWVDPTKGITGMICSQILPFGDLKVMTLAGQVEATVYADLKR